MDVEREFEWDNATDFVVQGPYISDATAPSELIGEIEDAGFQGAAGVQLTDSEHQASMIVAVVRFDSADGAADVRDLLHAEDLKQPCFDACVVTPTEYEVDAVPDAVAVHQAPNEGKPPPGHFKFDAYLAELAVGEDLLLVDASGPPGSISGSEFDRAVSAVQERAG